MNIDFTKLVPIDRVTEQRKWALDEPGAVKEAEKMFRDAQAWLNKFGWVRSLSSAHVGYVIPGVLGVFLVEIEPASEDVDRWNWVIWGDVPPAYISPEFASTPDEALEAYVAELQAWVDAVKAGEPTDELIPVDTVPTAKNADLLQKRLRFISDKVLKGST